MNWDWSLIATILYIVVYWVIPLVMLYIIPAHRKPSSATAWLLLILLFPLLGLLVFLILGSPKLSKRRRAQQREMDHVIASTVEQANQQPELHAILGAPIAPRYAPFTRLATNLGGMPPFAGNTVELLTDYQGTVDRIVQAIDRAQRYVHVEYFEFLDDATGGRVVDALIRAQQRGVACRVLIDHLGSFEFNVAVLIDHLINFERHRPILKRLRAGGVTVYQMLPVRIIDNEWSRLDLRNHRKIVVVDGTVGFTGSQNLVDWDYHKRSNIKKGLYYVELVAHVTGPVVQQLNATFVTDWHAESGVLLGPSAAPQTEIVLASTGDALCQVLPSGPSYDDASNLKLFTALIHAAQHTIVITNPYFVPDESLMIAITSAAQRDVDVTLIVSEIGDQFFVYHAQRSYYEALLQAGVKVYRHKTPVLLHAKHISIDDDIAVIGSSNMDIRSFQLDLEVTLIAYDSCVVGDMRRIEQAYLQQSRPLSLSEWQARPVLTKFFDRVARLTSALQ